MAINYTTYARYVFWRVAEPKPRYQIGKWLGRCTGTGDASGGNMALIILLSSMGEVYGQHGIWDIKSLYATVISGSVENGIVPYLEIRSNEEINGAYQNYRSALEFASSYGVYYTQYLRLPACKYHTSETTSDQTSILLTMPNINSAIIYLIADGYIYDERYTP